MASLPEWHLSGAGGKQPLYLLLLQMTRLWEILKSLRLFDDQRGLCVGHSQRVSIPIYPSTYPSAFTSRGLPCVYIIVRSHSIASIFVYICQELQQFGSPGGADAIDSTMSRSSTQFCDFSLPESSCQREGQANYNTKPF